MAEKINTIQLPKKVIKSNWRDDIDTDYATQSNIKVQENEFEPYDQEEEYISPQEISKESIARIKARNQRIGAKAFFFATRSKLAA